MRSVALLGLASALFIAPIPTAIAQAMPDDISKPDYIAPEQTIPEAQDIAYPGTMTLEVDATDNEQGIFKVTQTIPVAKAGKLTLLYPEWLPGNHAPRGEIEKVAGLEFFAGPQKLDWVRDNVDVYAFHVTVPQGVREITAKFQFVSATTSSHGRIVMAPAMLNLRWHQVSLYPAGYYVRQIPVTATAIYPDGWQAATAMRPNTVTGSKVAYETVDYDTLVDSPVFAGKYFQTHKLSSRVHLNIVADDAKYLKPKPDQIAKHAKLVKEAEALFGSHQYDRYDFLLALTDEMGGIGLEHHRSSENGVNREYFTDWDDSPGRRNLLPHEVVHSWNGKYRRPQGMWTPDFREPMRDDLLWVYEGQTQFWGYVLGARSGLYSKQDTLDAYAAIAAAMDQRVGRSWRPLIDTTLDPIIVARRPKPWTDWQRQEDYYNEGLLIWLEADQIIRRESSGKKSLENFAKAFFGGKNGDWGVVTYDEQDVLDTLNKVQPYDWASFVKDRVHKTTTAAPKNGLTLGGYRLVFTDKQSAYLRANDKRRKQTDLSYSLGLTVNDKGVVSAVSWGGPAFKSGMKSGLTISAVNGKAFSTDVLKQAIEDNMGQSKPIEVFAKNGDAYHNFMVDFNGGLLYPALEKIDNQGSGEGASEGGIDRLLKPITK
ncbi:M61 family metallopeptidase [Parasphingorhabdus halotolerans]|uniref:M61 family metallopeptidase n=1 Tax=Parasphingorhabdus halotolerans TaxID=2725558 RepID=A0A6H2DPA6_9SPHN|nr:M61 family metallopeptidase [Parasphingorhabdus halotolerans]QJB69795.1 M61 family metallopeptidase [Parasphingorhabdus halotolerans]